MEILKAVSVRYPKITVGRGVTAETSGQMQIKADGALVITLHYSYAYMDNSRQWALGRQLAEQLFPNSEIDVQDWRVPPGPRN